MYNKHRGDLYMKPRVFVSSTFYDLRYIREDLANYIRAHDFEAIMFEEGDIGYTPGVELDESCYENMRSADMAILIIGGQYGSPASQENGNISKFVSITRNEFRNAVKNNIPVFCFIDAAVHSEYDIYRLNKDKLEEDEKNILFRVVKNINVFRFIEEIYEIGNIPINTFIKSEDIKDYMGKQWSDMFKKYLEYLKNKDNSERLNSTVDDMNTILKQMKIMINKIGENTIKNESDYKKIIDEQQMLELVNFAENITKSIMIAPTNVDKNKISFHILNALKTVLNTTDIDLSFEIEGKIAEDLSMMFFEIVNPLVEEDIDVNGVNPSLFNNSLLLIKYLNDQNLFDKLRSIISNDRYFNNFFE